MSDDSHQYAGFWIRVLASLIDSVLALLILFPALRAIYGDAYFDPGRTGFVAGPVDFLLSWVVPAFAVIAFWVSRQATPGKMVLSLRVLDAASGDTLTVRQAIIRYLGYYVATIPLCLGLIWVAFDPRKQGWHDKLAGTVVIRDTSPMRRAPD